MPMDVPPVVEGAVLISDSQMEGVEFGDESLNPYDAFRGMKPVAVIQGGVNVYQGRFDIPLASALVEVRSSQEQKQLGHPEEALALAVHAAGLAPQSAIVQGNYADMLAASGLWQEAVDHYQTAEHLARVVRPDLQEDTQHAISSGMATAKAHL